MVSVEGLDSKSEECEDDDGGECEPSRCAVDDEGTDGLDNRVVVAVVEVGGGGTAAGGWPPLERLRFLAMVFRCLEGE